MTYQKSVGQSEKEKMFTPCLYMFSSSSASVKANDYCWDSANSIQCISQSICQYNKGKFILWKLGKVVSLSCFGTLSQLNKIRGINRRKSPFMLPGSFPHLVEDRTYHLTEVRLNRNTLLDKVDRSCIRLYGTSLPILWCSHQSTNTFDGCSSRLFFSLL